MDSTYVYITHNRLEIMKDFAAISWLLINSQFKIAFWKYENKKFIDPDDFNTFVCVTIR